MSHNLKLFLKNLTPRQLLLSCITIASLLLYLILSFWIGGRIKSLSDQQAAARWDSSGGSAQISCYFTKDVEADDFMIGSFERQLETMLMEVLPEEAYSGENGKRLILDAYSSLGTITITSESGKLETNAVGVGGDFFYFHPYRLVSGAYLTGGDLMSDGVVLDEDAAWQLFGSSDIAGQSVMIGETPHHVAGVIERPDDRLSRKAGLNKSIVFVSNETLSQYGTSDGIGTYELIAPNPVKSFVYSAVKEKLGPKEEQMLVVENSSRYGFEAILGVILDFGTRSMQDYAIRYPYWENVARGNEDIAALVLVLRIILLLIPAGILIPALIIKWKHRTFTLKDLGNALVEKKDQMLERARGEKDKWKHF